MANVHVVFNQQATESTCSEFQVQLQQQQGENSNAAEPIRSPTGKLVETQVNLRDDLNAIGLAQAAAVIQANNGVSKASPFPLLALDPVSGEGNFNHLVADDLLFTSGDAKTPIVLDACTWEWVHTSGSYVIEGATALQSDGGVGSAIRTTMTGAAIVRHLMQLPYIPCDFPLIEAYEILIKAQPPDFTGAAGTGRYQLLTGALTGAWVLRADETVGPNWQVRGPAGLFVDTGTAFTSGVVIKANVTASNTTIFIDNVFQLMDSRTGSPQGGFAMEVEMRGIATNFGVFDTLGFTLLK